MAKGLKTIAQLAQRLGVTTKTVGSWRDNFGDWPNREPDGSFSLKKHLAFCKRRHVGPYNPRRTPGAVNQRDELREAQRRLTVERAANTRIANERLRVEQQQELGKILRRGDAEAIYAATRAASLAASDEIIAEVERLLATPPTAESYQAMRDGVLRAVGSIGQRRMEKLNAGQ